MLTMIEEFHVTMKAPGRLPDRQYLAMRRVLNSRNFQGKLRTAVLELVKRQPQLASVRVTISR